MKELHYSRNCEEISIYAFNKISTEGDYRFLVRNWDEYQVIEIDTVKAEDLWKSIFDEYCRLSDDNTIIMFYETHQDLIKLKVKQFSVYKLIEVFVTVRDQDMLEEFAKMFAKFGYPIDLSKGIIKEADRIAARLNFLNNAINAKQKEYDDLKGDDGEASSTPFLEQLVMVEKHTKRDNIDIKTTSAAKWIYILKSIK